MGLDRSEIRDLIKQREIGDLIHQRSYKPSERSEIDIMADSHESEGLLLSDRQTDICDCRVALAKK